MNLNINRADIEEIGRALDGIKTSVPVVLSRAINKTLTNVKTDAAKRIGSKINLKAARIKKDFSTHKATVKAIKGSVLAEGGPVGLASFVGTKQVKQGVSVKIYRDSNRFYLRHAFIGNVKGSNHVFERVDYGGGGPYRSGFPYAKLPHQYRYPLNRKTGPRIEDVYVKPEIMNPVLKNAGDRMDINIESQIDFELSKFK